ncbi:MAG: sporulation initiation factor Spo0A C-terminal domain-containing protein [Clostridia bacterium]|nr:sporulation initiation factor Spo0A C-terminal domain-containing protein [Clostridia bacterium]
MREIQGYEESNQRFERESVQSIENLNGLFGYNIYGKNDKPTNGEFIALVADKLLMEEQSRKAV